MRCVCSVIDHRRRQNVVRTLVTHSPAARGPLFCSYHILTSSVIHNWTDARQNGIYLLIRLCFILAINIFNYFARARWTMQLKTCHYFAGIKPKKGDYLIDPDINKNVQLNYAGANIIYKHKARRYASILEITGPTTEKLQIMVRMVFFYQMQS